MGGADQGRQDQRRLRGNNASKAGLEGRTRGYAARLVNEGITVNAIAPSLTETDTMRGRYAK